MMILFTAKRWGWKDPLYTARFRKRIARAACRQIAYDHGYAQAFSHNALPAWEGRLNNAIDEGLAVSSENPLSPRHCGSTKYVAMIESQHAGYLHELFRYAQQILGGKSSFAELADLMNLKSEAPGEDRTTLLLHSLQVRNWFCANNGKAFSPKEKPLDTDEHKAKRLQ